MVSPASIWLSFGEMMRSVESPFMAAYEYEEGGSSTGSPHYFVDNFYANVYEDSKSHVIFTEQDTETHQNQQQTLTTDSSPPSSYSSYTNFFNHPHTQTQTIPKLEDFFFGGGGDSVSMVVPFSDNKTETPDSTLTHIYEGEIYFNDQQDLKSITTGIQTATNSGSDVDVADSVSITMTDKICSGSVNELGFSHGLSLGMNNNQSCCSEKAIVTVEDSVSNSCKKVAGASSFGQRTSIYRGVTRHRWTGRYEAHLWDNSCRREGQARKGRQVYLGGYDKEDKAARAYDLAALKYWGPAATTNLPISSYAKEVEEMKHTTKQEFIASLRRKSSGFARGASMYRGVTRHHQQGRWQARIGRVAGNKDLYLGTFATEEEAAEAYDIAAIKFRGANAVTNFEMNRYDVEAIASCSLPIGGASKRLKTSLESEQKTSAELDKKPQCSSNISFAAIQPGSFIPYAIPLEGMYHQHQSASESPVSTSSGTNPVNYPPNPAEYFLWPHQSY